MPKTQTQTTVQKDEALVPQGETPQAVSGAQSGDDRQQRISQRAYELYEQRQRDGRDGDDMNDWLSAEAEFRGQA